MRQVTSPTTTDLGRRRAGRLFLRLLVVASAVLGLVASSTAPASADSLQDQRDKVRKALAKTKTSISQASQEVKAASASLEESEAKLAKARQELSYIRGKLAKAREKDAEIARRLKQAEQELKKAEARVAQGEEEPPSSSRERIAFRKASVKVRPMPIASPTDFICVPSVSSAPANFSKAKRGNLTTT